MISFGKRNNDAVYAVDYEGNYIKYADIKTASEELSIPAYCIKSCADGKQMTAGKYTFVNSSEVEMKNSDGTTAVDTSKILEAYNKLQYKAVYSIDENGRCEKFESQKAAARQTGIPARNIFQAVEGLNKTASGYIFVRADEVENLDSNGTFSLDNAKVAQVILSRKSKSIYAISKDGAYKRYKSQQDAVKDLGILPSGISQCINGKKNSTCGYTFIKAADLEQIDEKGNIIFDEQKCRTIASSRFLLNNSRCF